MLVMERLYPLDYRAHEYGKRELWMDVFRDELHQLLAAGFAHRNIRMPTLKLRNRHKTSDMPGLRFDNIFLTNQGIRLIDVGISALRDQVGDRLFDRFVERELEELELFREYFLNR